MVLLAPGSFTQGADNGNYETQPSHTVHLSSPFYMSSRLVTFGQYERFRPGFRKNLQTIRRLTNTDPRWVAEYEHAYQDDDPVVGVNWHEAVAFCKWLSAKEGQSYRLPSESEWEYAAQSEAAAKEQLHAFTGQIEQWCLDWYGPYPNGEQTDPAGYREGTTRITRGGSSWTPEGTHAVAGRMSFLPADRYPGLGFRVVVGAMPFRYIEHQPRPLCQSEVPQERYDWRAQQVESEEAIFLTPIDFVKIPDNSTGPLYSDHNHFPSVTWCPNGDLLVTWFTDLGKHATGEEGVKLNIAASRLRKGSQSWDAPSLFWSAADRNDHSSALWTHPETGLLYHFQGTGSYPNQGNQTLFMRTSDDNGANWSAPRIMSDVRSMWNPHIVTRTREGVLILSSDLNFDQPMWGRIIISHDDGHTWHAPAGKIHGQHPGIVQLADGALMAVGRDNWNTEHAAVPGSGVPISTSVDLGESWSYRREPALGHGIDWRQRPVLLRLKEGPILYIGFTDKSNTAKAQRLGIEIVDQAGERRRVYGMFSALSFDEGRTWSHHKLVTPSSDDREYDGGGNTDFFVANAEQSEPAGYLQALQTDDHMIHLLSSKLHYRFNYKWLQAATLAAPK
ncbi:SUMF1/EgtB/PvdO family nonheme iron enzyme [Paenibacillus sabuli]|nr:SUMF1/EgtB/PvdO family nonheme iron enzyme [Paenibacillus sabuli]